MSHCKVASECRCAIVVAREGFRLIAGCFAVLLMSGSSEAQDWFELRYDSGMMLAVSSVMFAAEGEAVEDLVLLRRAVLIPQGLRRKEPRDGSSNPSK